MKDFFKALKTIFLNTLPIIVLLAGAFSFVPDVYADYPSGKLMTTINSGWNLKSLGSTYCGLVKMNNRAVKIENFPRYLDVYAYDGTGYVHARVTAKNLESGEGTRPLESGLLEKYLDNRVKKITDNRFTSARDYLQEAEDIIEQNRRENKELVEIDLQKIREYAERTNREVFTSLWIYNPGKDFSMDCAIANEEISVYSSALNLLFTNISDSEYSRLVNYVEDTLSDKILPEIKESPGFLAFWKGLFSGKIVIDRGWNFMSYSKMLLDNNGSLDLKNGNCNITKIYVFDNRSKKWVTATNAQSSLFGSGMVVFNNGPVCSVAVTNNILTTFKNFLEDSPGNTPPPLPN